MKSRLLSCVALLALALGSMAQTPPATNHTAFALAREGDKLIAPEARDRLTQIYSERSSNNLVPDVWYIDYFDKTTAFKTTELKYVGGQMMEISQPKHVLNAFSGTKQLTWRKLKVDSDRALAIALKEPQLSKLDVQAVQFWLERTAIGATWKIRFWTTRLGKPGQLSEVGDLYISCTSGEVLKRDLHF